MIDFDPKSLGARCNECPLKGSRPVPPAPAEGKPRFIIIGEGPGRLEIAKMTPFVGPSGRLLNKVLEKAGLNREEAHVSNAMACRAEDDRPDVKLAATSCCAPRLAQEIASLKGKKLPILALGQWAARAVLGVKTIMKTRGFVWQTPTIEEAKLLSVKKSIAKLRASVRAKPTAKAKENLAKAKRALYLLEARATYAGRTVIPSIHPAFILRGADGWYPVMITDFKRFKRLLDGTLKLEDDVSYIVVSTPAAIKRELSRLDREVVVDVETGGPDALNDELKCVGVGDHVKGHKVVMIWPWKRSLGLTLRAALKKHVVVTHFGPQFDHIVLNREKAWE
jgi:uracil-DNA glycosylase family 4